MTFLAVGTMIVWLALAGYMFSIQARQRQLQRQIQELEKRMSP